MSDANGHANGQAHGYVGARAPRVEDTRFLTGAGRFVDDLRLPAMAYASVVRSPIARGRIARCDAAAALAAPGVLTVLTPPDADGVRLPCIEIA